MLLARCCSLQPPPPPPALLASQFSLPWAIYRSGQVRALLTAPSLYKKNFGELN
jgi:hypothetical protein